MLLASAFTYEFEGPGIGELADEEGGEGGSHDAGHEVENPCVGLGVFNCFGGVGHEGAHPCEEGEEHLAHEGEEDDPPCGAEAPELGEDVPEHVGDGEDDGARVEEGDAVDVDEFHRHDVGCEIEGHHSGDHDDESPVLSVL